MKRKITSKLYEWKNMSDGRMPLLIYGARQVGKTFEMREFGSLYYKNTIYVNFETDERIGKYFETDIRADHVIAVLEKYYQVKIVPENTLIIFDEIQMCERALTSLKYFSEEAPEYHVMAAGSLLGVAVNREKYSFPVGKVQMLTMYPMDLEEVLWAKGKQMLTDTIREHYENNQPLNEMLHEEAMQEFYHYCIVGGMPAAVKADLAKDSPIEQTEIRQMLLNSYIADMTKYAKYSKLRPVDEPATASGPKLLIPPCISTFDNEKTAVCIADGAPILSIFPRHTLSIRIFFISSLSGPSSCINIYMTIPVLTTFDMTVAMPTPATPSLHTHTKNRLSTTLSTPETIRQ